MSNALEITIMNFMFFVWSWIFTFIFTKWLKQTEIKWLNKTGFYYHFKNPKCPTNVNLNCNCTISLTFSAFFRLHPHFFFLSSDRMGIHSKCFDKNFVNIHEQTNEWKKRKKTEKKYRKKFDYGM